MWEKHFAAALDLNRFIDILFAKLKNAAALNYRVLSIDNAIALPL